MLQSAASRFAAAAASLAVLCMELLHEVSQGLHALQGHGVVDGGAHAAHAAVALQL